MMYLHRHFRLCQAAVASSALISTGSCAQAALTRVAEKTFDSSLMADFSHQAAALSTRYRDFHPSR